MNEHPMSKEHQLHVDKLIEARLMLYASRCLYQEENDNVEVRIKAVSDRLADLDMHRTTRGL